MNTLIVVFFVSYLLYCFFNNWTFLLIYIGLIGVYTFLTQIKFFKTPYDYGRRKMQVASWNTPYDPQSHVKLKLDTTKTEKYLEEISAKFGEKITYTIFVIRLMALVLRRYPEIDGYIRFGNYYPQESVDVCCLVAVGDGEDLVNTTLRSVHSMSMVEIAQSLKKTANIIREKKMKTHNDKMNVVKVVPTFILGPIMQLVSYLSSAGIGVDFLGMPKFEFGSCVVTSIGSIGIDDGYAPIPPLSFAPLLLTVCKKRVSYYKDEKGEICEKSIINLNFTLDERFFNAQSKEMFFEDLRKFGENPDLFEAEMSKHIEESKSNAKKTQ